MLPPGKGNRKAAQIQGTKALCNPQGLFTLKSRSLKDFF